MSEQITQIIDTEETPPIDMKDETLKLLAEGYVLIEHIKKTRGEDSSEYKNAKLEFEELDGKINLLKKSELEITQKKVNELKRELLDIQNIITKSAYIDYFTHIFDGNKKVAKELYENIELSIINGDTQNIANIITNTLKNNNLQVYKEEIVSIAQSVIAIKNSEITSKIELGHILSKEEKALKLNIEKAQSTYENISIDEFYSISQNNKNNTTLENKLTKNNTVQAELDNSEYSYNQKLGIINIEGLKENINLSNKDKSILAQHPEAIDGIINTFKIFEKVGLSNLWPIKDKIFTSISNIAGVGFDIGNDYLNENEIKIFLNSILKSTGNKAVSMGFSLDDFIAKIEQTNGTQIGGKEKEVNMYGDSILESKFISKFFPRGSLYFNQSEFEKALV